MDKEIKWWQVALATIAVSVLGGLSTGTTKRTERKLYNRKLKQAPWAPPAPVFGPAWTLNNFFLLLALKRLLEDKTISKRKRLFIKQAAIWTIFFTFGYVYFKKKSPVLAAVWTLSDLALALTSILDAWKTDKKLAANYFPLLGWTGYAGSVALYQALKNPDPVTHTPALAN
ncbi:tryptophan-rich sensory protein [Flavisolibacter sp. BT320]|nr:tryptophan-rich sensory protein [Flavisolibacter longurius]